jgi:uncharacterized cupin superfamily protein
MALATTFAPSGTGPVEAGAPEPGRILAGDPRFRTWNAYESSDGKTFCGVWESTPGSWRIVYEEWESCTLISGRSVVTSDDGTSISLGPGDTLILEPGFTGTWTVVETTRKTYVIRL